MSGRLAPYHSLDAALGYFINPLFSIFLGAVLLKERLQPLQIAAIALAALAVGILALDSGGIPWVALTLAISWGFYALLRKTLPLGPNQGFFLEVLILSGPKPSSISSIWNSAAARATSIAPVLPTRPCCSAAASSPPCR